jgi:hypothetical protein
VALLVLSIPLAAAIGRTTVDEIMRPTSAVTIYARVLAQVMPIAAVTAAVVPLIDTMAAFTVRELLLGRRLRGSPKAALGRLAQAPVRSIGAVILGWLSLILVMLAVGWALTIAWQAIRTAFLATTSVGDLFERPDTLIVSFLLAAVFVTGLALCGFVAAFRAALLTLTRLRA